MLDFRHETFLTLCNIKNYTKTAEVLHITQPAVSQHIKFLEEYYQSKLFIYEGKTLKLTEQGVMLQAFAMTMRADSEKLKTNMTFLNQSRYPLNFGATLTIGEYTMPPILKSIMENFPNIHITMTVENTEILLTKLREGKIDFALLEGFFHSTEYHAKTLSKEKFIPICSPQSSLAGRSIQIADILEERIILREKGSGTRDIFEQLLGEYNLKTDHFSRICEIGNMSAIKQLVQANAGISFVYAEAVKEELKKGTIRELMIEDFNVIRIFNFVCLKNSLHQKEYDKWYHFFIKENIK